MIFFYPRFWFYGDDDATKRLEILDKYLNEFEAKKVTSAVVTQPLIPEPRRVVQYYAAGENEGGEEGEGEEGEEGAPAAAPPGGEAANKVG